MLSFQDHSEAAREISNAFLFMVPAVGSVAIFAFLSVVGWAKERRREREALYRHDTARKLVEQGAMTAEQFRVFCDDEAVRPQLARREALKIAGVVLLFFGAGLLFALMHMEDPSVHPIGAVPAGVGLALLLYVYVLARPLSKDRR